MLWIFIASGDVRNLVRTVNGLPKDYRGKCNILCNDKNPIVVARNLIVLFALTSPGPPLENAAELATHLMYSSALPVPMMIHLYRLINVNYGHGGWEGQLIFRQWLATRGKGKLHITQVVEDMKTPMEMFLSNYELPRALKDMHDIMLSPSRVDYRDRYFSGLKPGHRMALLHFRQSGVLAPFSANITHFTEPNR